MSNKKKALVIIPAYNEADSLVGVCEDMHALQQRRQGLSPDLDVLVVNDGSTDQTDSIVQGYGFSIVTHPSRQGYGAALSTGFAYCSVRNYEFVITMDADGQHRVGEIPRFLEVSSDVSIVSGSRYLPNSLRLNDPPAPEVNRLLTAIVNRAFNWKITDVGCGMKRIAREIFANACFSEAGYLFVMEFWSLAFERRAEIFEVPVPMIYLNPTRNHESKFGSRARATELAVLALIRSLIGVREPTTDEHWRTLFSHVRREHIPALSCIRDVLMEAQPQLVPEPLKLSVAALVSRACV